MLRLFHGEDTYEARVAIGKMADGDGVTLRWIDQRELEDKSAANILGQGSRGLFGREVLVVRDVGDLPQGMQADLVAAMEVAGDAADGVLWWRGKIDKRSVLYKKLGKNSRVFDSPTYQELVAWIIKLTQQKGGHIEEAAARTLVDRVMADTRVRTGGSADRWRLISELDKLLLRGDHIDEQAVKESVNEVAYEGVFTVLDALASGQKAKAVRGIVSLLEAGESEFYILSMLAYQYRTLLTCRRGIDENKSQSEIIRQEKLKPYTVQKNYPLAKQFTAEYLRGVLTKILACDYAIRRGKADQRTALVMLTLNLVS